jgi:hypothetical protein
VSARLNGGSWNPSTGGSVCAIIRVENRPAHVGQQARAVNALVAHLSFRVLGKSVVTVARAYWLEHASNEVSLPVGFGNVIVLGVVDGYLWTAMANRFTLPARYRSGIVIPSPEKTDIEVIQAMEIEVSLITPASGTTICRFYVDVIRSGNSLSVVRRS